jgi:pentatricopeptide repeat protein
MDAWANSGAVGAADRVHAILEVAIERQKKVVKDGYAPFGIVMKPSVIMFNTAINAWAKPNRSCMHGPKKAEDLARWMDDLNKSGELGARDEHDEDDAGLAPNTRSFTSIINAWAESEQYERDGKCAEQAEQILKGMIERYVDKGEDVKPNVVTFTTCIKAWSLGFKNPDFCNRAQAVYDRMVELYRQTQDEDFKPNVYTCNQLMGAWGKSRDSNSAERAEAVLNNMLNFCEPDMHSYNIVIDAYAKNRDAWGAYTVFEKLEKNTSLTPDIVSYNSTLNALAKDPRTAPEADALLKRMIAEGNVLPDRLSYTCVINAWSIYRSHGKLNCARNVATLLQTMLDEYKTNKKVKPDVTTFTSAIMACGNTTSRREDRLDALKFAIRAFELMKQSDEFDNPNYLTYSALIRVCSKLAEGRERALLLENVFRESCEQGMLSLMGLNMFKNATDFAVHRRYSIQGKDVAVPPQWCINVRFTDRPKSTK